MSSSMTIVVRPRGRPIKNLPESITVNAEDSAREIFEKIAAASRFDVNRLRVTKGSDGSAIANATDITVYQTGLRNKSAVDVKDLGPQISWRTVFLIEYFGPIIIHPLFYLAGRPIYSHAAAPSALQTLSLILVILHFAKREYETMFVHRFSLATMPFRNVFKNSAHYWLLSGVWMAYFLYAPSSPTAGEIVPALTYPGLALFAVAEVLNLSTHFALRGLRREGTTERGIPSGVGFSLVTCPNYMFEILAWVGFALVSRSLMGTLPFLLVAAAQMGAWASKKERRYRKEFGDKYKRKSFVMLPGIY